MKKIPFSDFQRKFFIPALCTLLMFSRVPAGLAEDPARVHFFHALKSKEEGNYLQAENLLQKAVEMEPENADFHFELGNLYAERGNLTGARLEYEQAVMINPFFLPAHFNLGLAYRDLGMMSEARSEFRKVLEIDPSHVKARLQIGYTYQEEGFFDEARQAFQEAQEADYTDQEPRRALEDLEHYEALARQKSQREFAQGMERNPFSMANRPLYADPYAPSSPSGAQRTSGQQALLQTGILLLQEMMARRSQAHAEGSDPSN